MVDQQVTPRDVEDILRLNSLPPPAPPQFHPGELQDLLDAVSTHLMCYRNHHSEKIDRTRARMQGLKAKLEGIG